MPQPPQPDPNKIAALQADLAKHGATLDHQANQAALDRRHAVGMADLTHAQQLEQQQQQAALTPPPGGVVPSETP